MDIRHNLSIKPYAQSASDLSSWLSGQDGTSIGLKAFALLDGAQCEGLPAKLRHLPNHASLPLFRFLGKPDLEAVGPWLIGIGLSLNDSGLNFSTRMAMEVPGVLWFQSPLSLPDLPGLLAPRMEAILSSGPDTYLRYYDPRVFSNLVEILKPEQWHFLTLAPHWHWIGHNRECCTLTIPMDLEGASRFPLPLSLDESQKQAITAASMPYEVMALLQEYAPDRLDEIPVPERHATIQRSIARSRAKGLRLAHQFAMAFLEKTSGA